MCASSVVVRISSLTEGRVGVERVRLNKNAIVTEIAMFEVAQLGKSSSYEIKFLHSLKI